MFTQTAKTKRLLCILFFLLPVAVFSQVKNYVGIVREKYYPASVSILEEYRDLLQTTGYTSYAKAIDSYLKGGFGSGFVYVASDGTNYIITNRHVVSQAETVSIEFEGPDGGLTKYDNLKVLNADEEIDLAILSFPKGVNPFKKGLTFSSKKIEDGQEVLTAGFPGLAGEPLWQLGKGSVTNASARIKDLIDPEISSLIQHSAQIDGGNSGGPLLTADKSAETGYAVVGVNTWKYRGRQDTNYSIPAITVQTYIKKVLETGEQTSSREAVQSRTKSFITALSKKNNAFTDIVKYISYDYVAAEGKELFIKALSSAPSAVRSVVIAVFDNYSPLEGMRYAVAWHVWTKFHDKDDTVQIDAGELSETSAGTYILPLKTAGAEKASETIWIKEHGVWRLETADKQDKEEFSEKERTKKAEGQEKKEKQKKAKEKSENFSFESTYNSYLQVGFDLSLTKGLSSGSSVTYFNFPDFDSSDIHWFGAGAFVSVDSRSVFIKDSVTNTVQEYKNLRLIVGPAVCLQVPMTVKKVHVFPYLTGSVGLNLVGFFSIENAGGLVIGLEPGVRLGYDFGANANALLGIAYKYQQQQPLFENKARNKIQKNSLVFSVIVVF